MKIKRFQAVLAAFIAVLFVGVAQTAFSGTEVYVFLNNQNDVQKFEFLSRLKGAASYSEEELIKEGLPVSDDESLVKTYRNIAAYVKGGKSWKRRKEINLTNDAIKSIFDGLTKAARVPALHWAFESINDTIEDPLRKLELAKTVNKANESFTKFLVPTGGEKFLNQRMDNNDKGGSNYKEFIALDLYYRFDRAAIKDFLVPPEVAKDIDLPEVALRLNIPVGDDKTHVTSFRNYIVKVPDDVKDKEAARRRAAQDTIEVLKKIAFNNAAADLRDQLQPRDTIAFARAVKKASENYQRYVTDFKWFEKPQVISRGFGPESLRLNVYFEVNKAAIKEFIVPPETQQEIQLPEIAVLRLDIPASDENTHVSVFRNQIAKVPDDVKDRDAARLRAAQDAIEALKKIAFDQAANDIKLQLGQPTDSDSFDRAVKKASENYQRYVTDFKWFEKPQVISRGFGPESLRLNVYFEINRAALQDALIQDQGITTVDTYNAYVEIFWNVPDKDVHPEVIATVVANFEDQLRQKGYEVVEFENIQGDLVALLKSEGGDVDDLYSADELKRFKANLDLRNIDAKFENGKRILADYADLLFGVTINTIEVKNNELTVRLTTDATLIERGDWLKLASSDQSKTVPHTGSTDNLIEASKSIVIRLAADLEPKVRKQLAQRKQRTETRKVTEREFSLIFKGVDKNHFSRITRKLSQSSKWEVLDADYGERTIWVTYKGKILDLAGRVEDFLEGAELSHGIGETGGGNDRIVFGGE